MADIRIVTPPGLSENRATRPEHWRSWRRRDMTERFIPAAQEVASGYLARRALRRFAGGWSLWALGVGIVIPGEFSGWNYGLITGGFGGLLVFTFINVYGIELTCRIALVLAALALGVLALFSISALPHFDLRLALDVPV